MEIIMVLYQIFINISIFKDKQTILTIITVIITD